MRFSINGGFLFEINDLDDEAAATRLDTITDQFNAHLDVFTMMLPEHVRDGDGGIFEVGYEGLDTDADRVVDLLHERHESEPIPSPTAEAAVVGVLIAHLSGGNTRSAARELVALSRSAAPTTAELYLSVARRLDPNVVDRG